MARPRKQCLMEKRKQGMEYCAMKVFKKIQKQKVNKESNEKGCWQGQVHRKIIG